MGMYKTPLFISIPMEITNGIEVSTTQSLIQVEDIHSISKVVFQVLRLLRTVATTMIQ